MKPSKLKSGDKLQIECSGHQRIGFFIRREPSIAGRKAKNFVRIPDFAGLDGPDDDGTTEFSDYDLSRRGALAD